MIDLRECPFCGSKMIDVNDYELFWGTSCRYCGAIGPGEHNTADQAAIAWNTRKEDRKKKLELSSVYGKIARK